MVSQQRTVAFALQHCAAVRRLQHEVIALALGIIGITFDAVIHPVFQSAQRKLPKQKRRTFQEIRQTFTGVHRIDAMHLGAGTLHGLPHQLQIFAEQLVALQMPRGCGQALQKRRYRFAVGRARQLAGELHHFGNHFFAHLRRD